MTEPTIIELRHSVEELRHSVGSLASRVGSLSEALTSVNEVHSRQQQIGARATRAIEEANALAVKLAKVQETVVPREEHERAAEITRIQTRQRARHVRFFAVGMLLAFYLAIFAVGPVVNSHCGFSGPNTRAEQSVCNAISPFDSHPLGGYKRVVAGVEQQIAANTQHIADIEAGKHPTPIKPMFTPPSDSRYDWSSPGAILFDLVAVVTVVGAVVWASHADEMDKVRIERLSS